MPKLIGVIEEDKEGKEQVPLLPICHTTQKAQIESRSTQKAISDALASVAKMRRALSFRGTEKSAGVQAARRRIPLRQIAILAADYKKYGGEQ